MIDKSTVDTTTMTLYGKYGKYSITVNRGDLTIGDILADVVRPLLLAAGYSEQNVDEYLGLEFDGGKTDENIG